MLRQSKLAAALLMFVCSMGAHAQEFVRHYFKTPVPMRLDATRLAVFDLNAGSSVPAYAVDPAAFQLPIPGWRLLASTAPGQSNADVARQVASAAAAKAAAFVSPVFLDESGAPIIITQDLLIGVRRDVPVERARQIVSEFGEIVQEGIGTVPNAYKVRSKSRDGLEVLSQANRLAVMNEIDFAEPDLIATSREGLIPNDPLFSSCWGLSNTGQFPGYVPGVDLGAVQAWDTTTGSPTIITVVLDSGVQSSHPDLIGRIVTPGLDATGQGGAGEPVSPCDRHGTAVSGCIVASINNGVGVVGIAPNTKVAAARVSIPNVPCNGSGTFQSSWIANSLAWAQSIGARVTNTSLSLSPSSSIVTAAYESTYAAGVIHFASAMNNGVGSVSYPASIPVVNSVAALDPDGNRSGFSNWGPGLDFSSPGSDIVTTDRTGSDGYVPGDYVYTSGTSFASPYAAGVAALILSQRPSLTPSQVETIMQSTARDLGTPGYDTDFGHGLVRADDAMQTVNGECSLTWEQQLAGQRPSARTSHATAWDSHRGVLVVFGGQTNSGITNETWEWNGSSWSLRSTSGPSPRVHSVASYDPVRQRTVLFGGRASGSTMFDETWEWDGSAWTLRSLPSRPSARSVAGMVFDSLRGRMVLFGGINSSFTQLGDTWEYDGSTWVLRATGGPSPREWPGMAYDSARQKTVLAGGTTSSGTSLSDTWEWDGSVGTWTFRNIPGPPPRGNKNLAYDAARGVVVLYSSYGNNTFWADHWEYDGAAWIRRTLPGPVARFSHPMVYDPAQQRVLLFGGEVAAGGGNTSWMDDLWEFDGTKWIPMSGSPPIPRFGAPRAFVPELGGAVTFGGAYAIGSQFFAVSNELWLQSPSGWGLLQTNNPTSRAYSALGAIGNGQLLMFGGLVGSNNFPENDLWRFSGTTWTQLYPSNAPFPRSGAASCVFTSTNRFIVFGGQWDRAVLPNTLHTIDTADPQHWVSFATVGPSRREDAMMAYDPVRDEAILCGGRNGSGFDLDDVWRLRFVDGSPEWTPMPSLGSINSWSGGSMFWDPGRQRILLYAKQQFGFDQFAIVEPTVYEWTGTNFVPIQVGDPPSLRRYASMGPTSASGDIRLFGGLLASDNATILGDTWAFNGVAEPSFPLPPTGAGTFERGNTVTLTLPVVLGQSPTLRWNRNGVPVNDGLTPSGSVISGSQTRTLVISNAQPADAGSYACTATNPCGSSSSSAALVDITAPCPSDFNGDGSVDGDDVIGFFGAWDAGQIAADFNQDESVDGDDVIGFFGAWDNGC
jgi:subtilisin family serine protease